MHLKRLYHKIIEFDLVVVLGQSKYNYHGFAD